MVNFWSFFWIMERNWTNVRRRFVELRIPFSARPELNFGFELINSDWMTNRISAGFQLLNLGSHFWWLTGERSFRSAETTHLQQSRPATAQSGDPEERHRVHRVAGRYAVGLPGSSDISRIRWLFGPHPPRRRPHLCP